MTRTEQEIRQSIENLTDSENQFQSKIEETLLEFSDFLKENTKNDDYNEIYKKSINLLEKYRYWVCLLHKAGSEKDTMKWVLGDVE